MKQTILIVEDEIVLQDVYKLILDSHGYHVLTASNGVEAFKQLKVATPDLILLDIFMPLMDGKEFLRNFDSTDYPRTKVVVYTNLSDRGTEKEMMGLGADAFILKSSLTPAGLVEIVQEHLVNA
jgi:CheY-like chemotaxis protein